MDKADELLEKLLKDHPREQIIGALEEMHNMKPEETVVLGKLCQLNNKHDEDTTNR